jgi:hypothetical protein
VKAVVLKAKARKVWQGLKPGIDFAALWHE